MDPMSRIGRAHYRRSRLKMKLTLPAHPLADIEPSVGFGIAMVTTARTRQTYPPERAGEAHRRLEAGGTRGRLVIEF